MSASSSTSVLRKQGYLSEEGKEGERGRGKEENRENGGKGEPRGKGESYIENREKDKKEREKDSTPDALSIK